MIFYMIGIGGPRGLITNILEMLILYRLMDLQQQRHHHSPLHK
jgi:hypothetical protein